MSVYLSQKKKCVEIFFSRTFILNEVGPRTDFVVILFFYKNTQKKLFLYFFNVTNSVRQHRQCLFQVAFRHHKELSRLDTIGSVNGQRQLQHHAKDFPAQVHPRLQSGARSGDPGTVFRLQNRYWTIWTLFLMLDHMGFLFDILKYFARRVRRLFRCFNMEPLPDPKKIFSA